MVMNFSKEPWKREINVETWMWKRNTNIGTWNVRSLFWSEALKVLHNELSKIDFDLVALQETRLGSGIQKCDNFTLFNSGSVRKKHEFGCRYYVRGEFLKYVKDFKIINERMCYLRLKPKWFSSALINVRARTNKKKTEEVKEEFYNLLEQNINQIANSDIEIIRGDFNAKGGKEDICKPTIGNEGLRNETDNNGIKMIQFTISKVFNVIVQNFHIKISTKRHARRANQLDHVLISSRCRSAITDIRALRGPDIGSDHSLVKINFKVKLRVKTERKYDKRKIVNIFQNSKWKQEFAIELNSRFKILENMEDEDNIDNNIYEKWENIKIIIKEAKQQRIEKDESTDIKNIDGVMRNAKLQ